VVWNVIREPLEIFYYDADEIKQDLAPNNRPQQVCRRKEKANVCNELFSFSA